MMNTSHLHCQRIVPDVPTTFTSLASRCPHTLAEPTHQVIVTLMSHLAGEYIISYTAAVVIFPDFNFSHLPPLSFHLSSFSFGECLVTLTLPR